MATRTIKFNGFLSGSAITIAAALSTGPSDSATTGAGGWGVANAGTAEIQIDKRSFYELAPEGLFFSVTNLSGFTAGATHAPTGDVYEPQFHDIEVFWNFGDDGAIYDYPVKTLAEHRNRNIAKGWNAAHVYRAPGTYTVTAFLVEMSTGVTAEATLEVTIKDGDALGLWDEVSYINHTGDYSNAPAGATTYTSINAAKATHDPVYGAGNVVKYILADGHIDDDPADDSGNIGTSPAWNGHSMYIVAEDGATTRPRIKGHDVVPDGHKGIIHVGNRGGDDPTLSVVLSGIDLVAGWDQSIEEGAAMTGVGLWGGSRSYVMLDDVTGYGGAGLNTSYSVGYTIILNNYAVRDFRGIGIYCGANDANGPYGNNRIAVLGCRLARELDSLPGGPKDGTHNDHGGMRIDIYDTLVVDGTEIYSIGDWNPTMVGDETYWRQQPCIRLNNTPFQQGVKAVISRCYLEGGATMGGDGPANTGFASATANTVVDSCVLVGTHMTYDSFWVTKYGGLTFRNTLAIMPDSDRITADSNIGNIPNSFIKLEPYYYGGTPVGLVQDSPIKIYSNTFLNLASDAKTESGDASMDILFEVGGNPFSDVTIENNILHQPNIGTPDIPYGPLDDTVLTAPYYPGYRDRWLIYYYTFQANFADGATLDIPYPGSLTQGDFAGTGHRVSIGDYGGLIDVGVTLNASDITITNSTGATLSAGSQVILALDRFGPAGRLLTQYATPPDTIWSGRPEIGSEALGAALTGLTSYSDIRMQQRPIYPSVGAWEI